MDSMHVLDATAEDFVDLVAQVKPTQWQDPTPCDGAPASRIVQLREQQDTIGGDDPVKAASDAAAKAYAAFAEPGALERSVHHPMGDLPGSQLFWMRVVDNVVHGWDLATALHLPAVIDGALAEDLYQGLVPRVHILQATGYIAPPRRPVRSDAPPQERLLALLGR